MNLIFDRALLADLKTQATQGRYLLDHCFLLDGESALAIAVFYLDHAQARAVDHERGVEQ